MNITSPILTGATRAAELPGDSVTSLLRAVGFSDGPDGGQSQFRLRLPASPSRSPRFGPWHLADGIVPVNGGAVTLEIHNTFAIRYRVL